MGHSQRDQCLFSLRQRPFRKDGTVITHEFFPQDRVVLPHVSELSEILRMVIGVHGITSQGELGVVRLRDESASASCERLFSEQVRYAFPGGDGSVSPRACENRWPTMVVTLLISSPSSFHSSALKSALI